MKLFLDENLPKSLAKELENIGFEVEHARYAGFLWANDSEIANYAKKNKMQF